MNEKFYGTTGVNVGGCGCDGDSSVNGGIAGRYGRTELMKRIQEYNFMMIEAGLFLNNQPCCEAAQETFAKYRAAYLDALDQYESCYGPLTYGGADIKRDGWKWVNTPWPWEVEEC